MLPHAVQLIPSISTLCDRSFPADCVEKLDPKRIVKSVVATTVNVEIASATGNFNDRSHFVRVIDLQDDGNFDTIAYDMAELAALIWARDIFAAVENLNRQIDKKQAPMADLVE